MHTSEKSPSDNNDKPTPDPATQESIDKGKKIIEIQKDQETGPKEKKESDAAKDAEKWRNEG